MNYHWDLLVFGCFWFMAQLHTRNRVFPTSTSTSTNSSKKMALISFPGFATQSMRQPRFRLCHSVSLILAVLWPVHASLPPTLAPIGRTKLCDRRVTSSIRLLQTIWFVNAVVDSCLFLRIIYRKTWFSHQIRRVCGWEVWNALVGPKTSYGVFHKWGIPKLWMVYNEKSY